MKTMTITDIMADFLDSIRAYEHESGESIHFDERESSEFVDMYFNNEGKLKAEKQEPLFTTEDGVEVFDENYIVYCITRGYNKHEENHKSMRKIESYLKVFVHESNADEYILWNKPVFSLKDIDKIIEGYLPEFDKLKKLAEKRVKQ